MSKLVGIKTYERFRSLWENDAIDEFSLNFIIDTGLLYTHGIFINGAVFGTAANGAVPLSIAGITNTLALSSHTHSNYLEKNADIDISSYKIKSGDKDLLFYSGGSLYLGNITSPTYISGNNLYSVRGTNVYDILDTSNFSVSNTLPTGYTYNNTAYIKYGSNSHQIDYVKRINTSLSFDYLNTYTLAGTNLLNGVQYGYITLYTDNVYTNPSWAQLRINIPGKAIQYRTSADANTWINLDQPNIPLNALNVAGIVSAPSSTTTNKVWKTDGSGNPAWRDELSYTFSNLKFQLISGTDLMTYNTLAVRTILAGSNVSFSHNDGVLTINAQSPTYGVVSKTLAGLAPQLPNEDTVTKFLRQDGTWATPTYTSDTNTWREIKVNGTQKRSTAITSGDLNFINGSNTTVEWTSDNKLKINSTWIAWKGATDSANGTAGYMPAPTSAQRYQFLRGDGSWVSLNNYSLPTASNSTLGGVKTGAAITDITGYTAVAIKDGVIYYKDTNTTYSFSNLLFLQTSGTNLMTYNSQAVRTVLAGSNITFTHSNNVLTIAAKDTTYSTVSKTAAGLCPTLPNETTTTKYLRLDGSWVTPPDNNTWKAANASQEGYVPKSTANKILRANGDGTLYWGDDANTTYTFYNLLFQNSSGTTVDTYKPTTSPTKTLKAGSNVTISAASNVITIASTDTNTWRGILDNLTSSSNTTESLSAKQGYLLANGSARDNTKLPLSGGTLAGHLKLSGTKNLASSWDPGVIAGSDGHDKVVLTYLASSTNGACIGGHNSNLSAWAPLHIGGTEIDFRINESRKGYLNSSYWYFDIPISGNSSKAPIITTGGVGGYREGIRIAPAGGWSDLLLLGTDANLDSGTSANSWFFGNNGGNLYITKNGSTSGSAILSCVNNAWSVNGNAIYHAGNLPAYPTKSSWNYNDMYVASVSISGNNLRINKNGANTDLTIPYATSAGSATYASSYLANRQSIGSSSQNHAQALQSYFNSYKSSIPRNCLTANYSSALSNGSLYFGYFLSGYDSAPYGGFYVCHYGTPYYVGISNGSYTQQQIITSSSIGSQSVNYATSAGSVAWSNVSSKPATATRWPAWSEVTDKPSTFTPALPYRLSSLTSSTGYINNPDNARESGFWYCSANGPTGGDCELLVVSHAASSWCHQLCFKFNNKGSTNTGYDSKDLWTRMYHGSNKAWTSWFTILTSGNVQNFALPISGGTLAAKNSWLNPARLQLLRPDGSNYSDRCCIGPTDGNLHLDCYSGNHAIYLNYYNGLPVYFCGGSYYINGSYYNGTAAAANSVAWSNVSSRPTKVSQFTNDSGYITASGDANIYGLKSFCNKANNASYMQSAIQIREYNFGGSQSDSWAIAPRLSWHWSGRVQAQIGLASNNHLYISEDGSFSSPQRIYCDNYHPSADAVAWANVTGKPTLLGAINYNNNSNSTYQVLWGSGNACYGTAGIYVNPYYNYVYATSFYTTSDRSKKQDISEFSEHIRKFQMKDTKTWHYGVIAQEVEEMFRDGEEGNMTVNYNSVLSYYVGQLENKVKELEEKIKVLETKQNKLI